MTDHSTKQKVVRAATTLFYKNGFHGTTVRDIASHASVNVSLISYYFKSKQGLFEYAVTTYYERFFERINEELSPYKTAQPLTQLQQLIKTIIQYRQEHYELSLCIQRELSLDTLFVRELNVTYLAKEHHLISRIFFDFLNDYKQHAKKKSFLLMQLQGMLIAPYTIESDWKNHLSDEYSHRYFVDHYVSVICEWLDYLQQ